MKKLIDNIRNKSQAEKIRIIWMTAGAVAILMLIIWVLTAKYYKHTAADTTLFKTIGQGVRDIQSNYSK